MSGTNLQQLKTNVLGAMTGAPQAMRDDVAAIFDAAIGGGSQGNSGGGPDDGGEGP